MKTKDKILQTTLELFNNQGVETVTTLYISKKLGISQGNLHYHFPNRNSLITALVDEFLGKLGKLSESFKQIDFENFYEFMFMVQIETYRKLWEYRFVFNDRLVIQRRTDYLDLRFREMLQLRKMEFDIVCREMKERNFLNQEISQEVLDAYFTQIVIGNNSWVSYHDLFDYEEEPYIFFAVQSIWAWRSFLNCTDEEMRQGVANAIATARNKNQS